MLAIIDYGAGNTYNVEKAFAYLGVQATLTADPAKILASDGLILPGVGAFNAAMTNLKQRGLVEPIKEAVKKGTPFLGICLRMQMLFDYSTEYGQTAGLGFIPGQVVELPKQPGLLVPEVGWNQNRLVNPASAYRQVDGEFTYFVHSYYAQTPVQNVVSVVDYGVLVPAIVQKDNVVGMQFHPEKSGTVGLGLLEQFLKGVEK